MKFAAQQAKAPGRLVPRSFFKTSPDRVAPRLLGKVLVHSGPSGLMAGRIVEVEAYLGPHNNPPDPAAHAAQRTSSVAKAVPSPAAQRKAAGKRTDPADGEPLPVHSFHTLLGDLATLTRNVVRLGRDHLTAILATPTQTQRRALDLLGITPTA